MEFSFGPAGKLLNAPQVTELVDLERQPRTGSVQYVVTPGAAMKAEWALLLDNGRILHPRSSAGGVSLAAPPVLPFELLPTDEATYLLTVDPKSGPTFTPL
jgi:hypothetical protein